MRRKTFPLTSVRFFLACFVLFHHSVRPFFPVFSARGDHGVPEDFLGIVSLAFPASASFFFLLSGYVLSLVYLRNGQVIEIRRFFAARFARLYPLYFVMLILTTPELLATQVQRHGMRIGSINTAEIFAANVAMVPVWYPSRLLQIDLPSWSLCGEVFFYACFPLLGALLWRLRGTWLWMTALTLYVAGQVLVWKMRTQIGFELVMVLPPLHLSTFALGMLLARWQTLQQEQDRKRQIRVWQASAVLVVSAGAAVLSVFMVPFFQGACTLQRWAAGAGFCGFYLGAISDLYAALALVERAMAGGPGELQLCAVPYSYADSEFVSAPSLGNRELLSGIRCALRRSESVELPLFRDAGPLLVSGTVSCVVAVKYSGEDVDVSSWFSSHSDRCRTFLSITR